MLQCYIIRYACCTSLLAPNLVISSRDSADEILSKSRLKMSKVHRPKKIEGYVVNLRIHFVRTGICDTRQVGETISSETMVLKSSQGI